MNGMDSLNILDDESLPEAALPERFDATSQKIIEQRGLLCLLCHKVLVLAVQVTCGARFCSSCFDSLLARQVFLVLTIKFFK